MRLKTYSEKHSRILHTIRNHPDIEKISHPREIKMITDGSTYVGYIQRQKHLISIAIHPTFQSKGYGTEALKKFCKKGDEAEILWGNIKSEKAFKKAGFKPYATRFIKT